MHQTTTSPQTLQLARALRASLERIVDELAETPTGIGFNPLPPTPEDVAGLHRELSNLRTVIRELDTIVSGMNHCLTVSGPYVGRTLLTSVRDLFGAANLDLQSNGARPASSLVDCLRRRTGQLPANDLRRVAISAADLNGVERLLAEIAKVPADADRILHY